MKWIGRKKLDESRLDENWAHDRALVGADPEWEDQRKEESAESSKPGKVVRCGTLTKHIYGTLTVLAPYSEFWLLDCSHN